MKFPFVAFSYEAHMVAKVALDEADDSRATVELRENLQWRWLCKCLDGETDGENLLA